MRFHKCPKCKERIDETIVNKDGKEKIKPLLFPIKDSQGNWIWKNLFHIDYWTIVIVLLVLFMTYGYKADIAKCEDAIEYPCKFCNTTGCCKTIGENLVIKLGEETKDNSTQSFQLLPQGID